MEIRTIFKKMFSLPLLVLVVKILMNVDGVSAEKTRVSTDRSYRVPLTYTTWEVSALSLDRTKQTPSKAELKVTSPFHIRLQLPNSAKAMEPTMLAATVINNLPYDAEVLVALDKNDGWMNLIPTDRNGKTVNQKVSSKVARLLKIKRGSLGIALFPILPLDNTNLQVRISAKTQKNDEDAVEATLRVDPPGKQVMKTWQRLVNQKEGESNNDVIDTRDPEIMGYNTTRLIITARGDVIGPSINEVANKVPGLYGARTDSADTETVVKTIGPRLLLSKYYEAMRMKNYGRDNYTEDHERLLSMQLPDGSFSSFGALDIRGSTWMTATVLKILKDLYSFGITVDDTAITKATNWLAEQQKADGSFEENGRLVEINLQGGSGEGPVELTAYVTGILVDTPCLDCTQTMTNRAKVYLEKEADAATSAHQLAMLANTLQLLKSIKVPGLLERLERMATKKDNMKYWDNVDTPDSVWYPVEEKIDPIDLETASYVLSTHRNAGKLKAALPVLRWIISQQRNGFREISDISTETLLQLLTLYSGIGQDIDTSMMNLDIRVSSQTPGQPFTHNFRITPENTLLLQSVQVPKDVKQIQLTSRGPGIALVEVEHYHSEPQDPHTTLDVALANETAMSYTVVICPRLFVPTIGDNWARLEVEIPEGLTPFIDKNNWKVRSSAYNRHEIADGRIYIYLQSPDRRDSCIPVRFFLGTKTRHIPAKQPSRVMLYTKNNKNKKITKFFQSAIGKMNTLCQMRCGPNCIC
ncbi:hypothetical protein FSP39_007298 [Pinctada imbricata]|uniref:Alpha-2-macroglobulin domain-containing protein n=1 Tax=Pinctada imbricata TaxID=66713 RepID=A0AA88YCX2_PINIB|nr:hypothetical protein FSP39_007298 [Pinctada imbricata]